MALVDLKDTPTITAAEWQARVDLAAAHRLAVMHGFSEGIFNHLTLSVPGKTDRYYQIPFGLHWSEVTASCFMEVGWDGTVLAGEGEAERSAYCIHAPIHRLVPQHAGSCTPTCPMPAPWRGSKSRSCCRSARPRSAFSTRSPTTMTTPASRSTRAR